MERFARAERLLQPLLPLHRPALALRAPAPTDQHQASRSASRHTLARRSGHGLPAPVQPAPAGEHGAPQPDRPRADGHQLLARRRRGERARHPPPHRHRPRRHRLRHRRRDDARHEDRPPDGHLPRRRRRQLHPRPRPARRGDAPLRREVRGAAPAPRAPVRDPPLQHPRRHRPRPQAPLVGRPRDHLRERRGEGQGDPRGVDRRDPRARRPLQRGRLAGEAGRLRRRRAPRRPRLPPLRVHEPLPQHAHRPVRGQLREPDAVPARRHRLDQEEVREELPGARPLLVRGVVRGRSRHGGGPRDSPRPRARRLRRARPLAWACRRAPVPASTRRPTRRAGRRTPPRRRRRS